MSNSTIKQQAEAAMRELLAVSKLKPGELVVVGCSSSEIVGQKIGKGSSPAAAREVVEAIMPVLKENGLLLAAECCEHLNAHSVPQRIVRL